MCRTTNKHSRTYKNIIYDERVIVACHGSFPHTNNTLILSWTMSHVATKRVFAFVVKAQIRVVRKNGEYCVYSPIHKVRDEGNVMQRANSNQPVTIIRITR